MKRLIRGCKNLLKKVLPMPAKGVKREFDTVTRELKRAREAEAKAFRDEAGLICDALDKTYAAHNARLAGVEQTLAALGSALKANRDEIAALKKTLDAIAPAVAQVGGKVDALAPKLAAVDAAVAPLAGKLAEFRPEIAALKPEIAAAAEKAGEKTVAEIAALKPEIAAAAEKASEKTAAEIAALKPEIVAAAEQAGEKTAAEIAALKPEIVAAAEKAGEKNAAEIAALKPEIAAAAEKAGEKTAAEIAALKPEIAAVAKAANSLGARLGTEFGARFDAVPTAVAGVQAKLEKTAAAIVGKVDALAPKLVAVRDEVASVGQGVADGNKHSRETFWAEVFNDSIADCAWLKKFSCSASGWAAGYQLLYLLYRVLDSKRPTKILDIGLGQTSRLIARYAAANPTVRHVVVEESETWMKFFRKRDRLPKNSEIVRLDYRLEEFPGCDNPVRVFDGFKEAFAGEKFDLIVIDAPFSGDMKELARVDLLRLLPDGVADSYVILVDDTNRRGERRMVDALVEKLQQSGFSASSSKYRGRNECHVIVSDDNAYFKTI